MEAERLIDRLDRMEAKPLIDWLDWIEVEALIDWLDQIELEAVDWIEPKAMIDLFELDGVRASDRSIDWIGLVWFVGNKKETTLSFPSHLLNGHSLPQNHYLAT
jgi:hypothetical protein